MLRARAVALLAAFAASEEVKVVTCLSHTGDRGEWKNVTCDGDTNLGQCARWTSLNTGNGKLEVSSGCDNYECANKVGEGQSCCVMNRGTANEKKIVCYQGDFNGDGWAQVGNSWRAIDYSNYSHLNATFNDPEFCNEDCDPSGCGVTNNMKCTMAGSKVLGTHKDKQGQTVDPGTKNKGSHCWWYMANEKSHPTVGGDDDWCSVLEQRDTCCKMLYRNSFIYCRKGTFGRNPTKADFDEQGCNKSCITKFRHDFGKHFASTASQALTSVVTLILISSML